MQQDLQNVKGSQNLNYQFDDKYFYVYDRINKKFILYDYLNYEDDTDNQIVLQKYIENINAYSLVSYTRQSDAVKQRFIATFIMNSIYLQNITVKD